MIRHQTGESTVPLYKLTSPSGKAYIGITTGKMATRMRGHQGAVNAGSQYAIHCAIRKYGRKSFTVDVLDDECDIEKLNELEVSAIAKHGTLYPNGYNLTTGGDGVAGPHSSERAMRMWANRPDEVKSEMVQKMGDASRKFWSGVGDDELTVMRERGAKAAKAWWDNATPEQRADRARKVKNKITARPEQEKARLAEISSKAASAHWANQTNEERQAHAVVRMNASKNTWANLSDDQRAERGRKMSEGRAIAKAKRLQNAAT